MLNESRLRGGAYVGPIFHRLRDIKKKKSLSSLQDSNSFYDKIIQVTKSCYGTKFGRETKRKQGINQEIVKEKTVKGSHFFNFFFFFGD